MDNWKTAGRAPHPDPKPQRRRRLERSVPAVRINHRLDAGRHRRDKIRELLGSDGVPLFLDSKNDSGPVGGAGDTAVDAVFHSSRELAAATRRGVQMGAKIPIPDGLDRVEVRGVRRPGELVVAHPKLV